MAKVQSSLIDPATGKPFVLDREVMTSRVAQATLTGVRQAVGMHVSGGLTPQGLASMLRGAEDGDCEAYLALAEEMEEKETQYLTVLGTRKRQVSQLDKIVQAASSSKDDQKIADAVKEQFLTSGLLEDRLFDILDAVGKGFSLCEIIWDLQGNTWNIRALEHVDPRFVRFDRETRRIPLLRGDNDGGIGLPLQPFKFLYTEIKAKSGIPVRAGIARPISWIWMFKNFSIKDWVQFCEIYGMPLRLGKYAPGSSEEDKNELLRAVAMISQDAAAIIPQNMSIDFQDTKSGGSGGGVHEQLARYFDEQTAKVVLGQAGTTDSTPGKLGGQADHTQVREDIERADARAASACINQSMVRPFVDFNFGPQEKYPTLNIGRPEQKNVQVMVDAAAKFAGGMKIRAADIRSAVGFSEPQEGDELIVMPAAPPAQNDIVSSADLKTDLNSRRTHLSLLAAELVQHDALDRAATEASAKYRQIIPEAQLETAFASARSYDDLKARLKTLGANLDTDPFADLLARRAFQAFVLGREGHSLKGEH